MTGQPLFQARILSRPATRTTIGDYVAEKPPKWVSETVTLGANPRFKAFSVRRIANLLDASGTECRVKTLARHHFPLH